MKIKLLHVLCFFLVFSKVTLGQSYDQILNGTVVQQEFGGRTAIANASVFILGVDKTKTDANGVFKLNLNQCRFCRAGVTTLTIIVNSDYGNTEYEYNVPENPSDRSVKVMVPANNRVIVSGIVKDQNNERLLEGITVSVMASGEVENALTNSLGQFKLELNNVGDRDAVTLIFKDSYTGKYKDTDKTIYVNKTAPPSVFYLSSCEDCGTPYFEQVGEATLYKIHRSRVIIQKGNLVTIKANGQMRVGNFVGMSPPEGLKSGVLGLGLQDYSYIKNQNHAVLCFRFGPNDDWKFYDKESKNRYIAEHSGYLEFMVNDNKQSDNSGTYDVNIIVRR